MVMVPSVGTVLPATAAVEVGLTGFTAATGTAGALTVVVSEVTAAVNRPMPGADVELRNVVERRGVR